MIATSGFLTAIECMHQNCFRPGLRPGPRWGAYTAPPDLLAGLRDPTSKRRRRGGRGERGEKVMSE